MQVIHTAIRIIACALMVVIAGCSCHNKTANSYDIDLMSPSKLYCGEMDENKITAARVYVTGPMRSFDGRIGAEKLLSMNPVYETSDTNELKQLLKDLAGDTSYPGTIASSALYGYTCHLLLMDTNTLSLIHLRVFVPEGGAETFLTVYPRSDTGFVYRNIKLLPWLRHVLLKSNMGHIIQGEKAQIS